MREMSLKFAHILEKEINLLSLRPILKPHSSSPRHPMLCSCRMLAPYFSMSVDAFGFRFLPLLSRGRNLVSLHKNFSSLVGTKAGRDSNPLNISNTYLRHRQQKPSSSLSLASSDSLSCITILYHSQFFPLSHPLLIHSWLKQKCDCICPINPLCFLSRPSLTRPATTLPAILPLILLTQSRNFTFCFAAKKKHPIIC